MCFTYTYHKLNIVKIEIKCSDAILLHLKANIPKCFVHFVQCRFHHFSNQANHNVTFFPDIELENLNWNLMIKIYYLTDFSEGFELPTY